MDWNTSLVKQIEETVEELGEFLQDKGLAEQEIARTKEVCHDFCNFLGSEYHNATNKQFTIYQQLHSTTPEDEQAYSAMMSNIKEYFKAVKMSYEAERTQMATDEQIKKVKKGGSLANAELERMFMNVEEESQPKRKKRISSVLNDSEKSEFSAPLLSDSQIEKATKEKITDENSQLSEENARLSASLAMMFSEAEKQAGPTGIAPKTTLSNDFVLNKRKSKSGDSLVSSETAAKKEDSISKALEDDGVKHEDLSSEDDAFSNMPSTSPDEQYVADVAPNKDDNLVRSVDGVQYNFSQKNIRKMRNFEKQKRQNDIKQSGNNPIDKSLLGGFQPYLFDGSYLIDIPLPDAEKMQPMGHDIVVQYIISLAPCVVLLIIGILGLLIDVYPMVIALILAVLAFFVVKRDVLPANQLTPVATILAYLNAKKGRCYGMARTLIAQPENKQSDEEFSFSQIWAPEPKFIDAMKNRFHDVDAPELRVVAGSEANNQILYIHVDGDNYWLVPMVRLKNNKWYITDPAMTVHTVSKK